jgi:hypothetical protein
MDMRGKLSADSQSNSAKNIMEIFLIKQRKSPKKTFTKICPVKEELFYKDIEGRTDGQTNEKSERTKLIVAFRKFSKGPKKKNLLPNLIMFQIYYLQHEKFILPT